MPAFRSRSKNPASPAALALTGGRVPDAPGPLTPHLNAFVLQASLSSPSPLPGRPGPGATELMALYFFYITLCISLI